MSARVFWLDAQLPPSLCSWLKSDLGCEAVALKTLQLRDAEDLAIFIAAKAAGATIVSKDYDFVELVSRLGAPPQLLWLTCGNVTTVSLQDLFSKVWSDAVKLLDAGEPIVEIGSLKTN